VKIGFDWLAVVATLLVFSSNSIASELTYKPTDDVEVIMAEIRKDTAVHGLFWRPFAIGEISDYFPSNIHGKYNSALAQSDCKTAYRLAFDQYFVRYPEFRAVRGDRKFIHAWREHFFLFGFGDIGFCIYRGRIEQYEEVIADLGFRPERYSTKLHQSYDRQLINKHTLNRNEAFADLMPLIMVSHEGAVRFALDRAGPDGNVYMNPVTRLCLVYLLQARGHDDKQLRNWQIKLEPQVPPGILKEMKSWDFRKQGIPPYNCRV